MPALKFFDRVARVWRLSANGAETTSPRGNAANKPAQQWVDQEETSPSSSPVMDAGLIQWKFEAIAVGGTGSADPSYPEITDGGAGLDLSTLPAVLIDGGENLLAAYSAASKNLLDLPSGMGLARVGVTATTAGGVDVDGSVTLVFPNQSVTVVLASGSSTNSQTWVPFTSGSYALPEQLGIECQNSSATTGSYLVTVTVAIFGFMPATFRDHLTD